ncbi:MAG: tRNA uridine-5-carboxymethylaminomethyl(34) synthesis GTPase MnmE [Clostridia bacterium]|nr:tRNA uridine-5-carboxymethylaminomethyl(34) synthesis GTPase MnmE [Clostridia bacterium]
MLGDTIAAVSTPRGKGGVAMIRISGPDAAAIANRIFIPASGRPFAERTPRTAVYGTILAPDHSAPDGWNRVDDGIAVLYKAPASFTGETVAEICCHGGILLTETVLAGVFALGARQAEAGEFTRRGFVNGKMGLDAAEALANLLEATSREQIKLSHAGMTGTLSRAIKKQYDRLCLVLSSVYAAIDYPDEDLKELGPGEIGEILDSTESEIRDLVSTYGTGHAIAEGIPTVICGAVNAGKSSLYNRLVGRDAAIVTDIAGTTRDLLTETVTAGRVTLRLTDTAGLRSTDDPVEKIGVARALEQVSAAELILALFDGSRPAGPEDKKLAADLSAEKASRPVAIIPVITKSDLPGVFDISLVESLGQPVRLSALTGEGLSQLNDAVDSLFIDSKLNTSEDAIVANARQYGAMLRSLQAFSEARQALADGLPLDIVGESVEQIMECLCEVDGRKVSEDIVSSIFSHFCVGK